MSASTSLTDLRRRLPFGIGTVVFVLVAAMLIAVGWVLATGSPGQATAASYSGGRLRGYEAEPAVAWTQSSDTLPGYGADTGIEVADTWRGRWLLAYPSGLGRAFLLVDRATGKPVWHHPVVAGLGGCAITESGQVGCAVRIGDVPDGFYLVDDDGVPGSRSPLDDTAQVVGVGPNYLRIDQAGYRVDLRSPDGHEIWSRTFAAAAQARYGSNGLLTISTVDGARFVVDPATGRDQVTCTQCEITVFDDGITVQHNELGHESVAGYAITDGRLGTRPTFASPSLQVVGGPSTLPVLTGTGPDQVDATQGRYEIRDPARAHALWQITDTELSKANTKPCGTMVAFALKDRSRVIYTLTDGKRVGRVDAPAVDNPDVNIDQLACVGSSGSTLVFADHDQITAYDAADGHVAWTRSVIGTTEAVDGYVVVHEGTSLTVLQPR